jgi:hypothetical protein
VKVLSEGSMPIRPPGDPLPSRNHRVIRLWIPRQAVKATSPAFQLSGPRRERAPGHLNFS